MFIFIDTDNVHKLLLFGGLSLKHYWPSGVSVFDSSDSPWDHYSKSYEMFLSHRSHHLTHKQNIWQDCNHSWIRYREEGGMYKAFL